MPWVRYDDGFEIHRKVSVLSDAGFRLHFNGIQWCARNLTDGVILADELDDVAPRRMRKPLKFVPELVDRGLWIPLVNGWSIHDYLDFQPSKEKVLADRKKAAERQQKWRDSKGSHGVTNGVSNATPTRPAPPRREGGAGGGGKPARLEVVHSWCGQCDEDTRLVELDERGTPSRCPRCHPRRSAS